MLSHEGENGWNVKLLHLVRILGIINHDFK
jgi:hypothetical protein